MANYTLANLVKAQIKLGGEFASNDTRFRIPVIFKLFLEGAEELFPNYKTLKTSDTRSIEANYWKRTATTLLTTGRSHNHTGTGGDSGVMTPTWATYSDTFSMTLKQADTSTWSWQEEFNNEIMQKIITFADGLDAVASNYLFANRSGVNTAAVKGTFDTTNDVYEIVQSTFEQDAIMISRVVMDINKYQGQELNIVCDSYSYTTFLRLAAQGATNATNQSFQFMNVRFLHDASLTTKAVALDATYVKGFWEVIPKGHIGVLNWIPKQNRQGLETKIQTYGSINNPVDGLQYAFHSYETRADGTSVNGQKQDEVIQSEISIDLFFTHAPSSTANETPIQAFALV